MKLILGGGFILRHGLVIDAIPFAILWIAQREQNLRASENVEIPLNICKRKWELAFHLWIIVYVSVNCNTLYGFSFLVFDNGYEFYSFWTK